MIEQFIATYKHPFRRWEDCLSMAAFHRDKFVHYWGITMNNHYSTGAHIDATVEMEKHGKILGEIERWCHSNVPAFMYEQVCEVMNETPR